LSFVLREEVKILDKNRRKIIMARTNFENLRVYQLSEQLADKVWDIVLSWDNFAKDTVGKHIAEGEGRRSFQDNRRFCKIARGSLQETQHWLKRAFKRNLLTKTQIETLKPLI
jgi:four helix bundle protein